MVVDDRHLAPQQNNLTLVRLILASAVIWTHCFWRVTGYGEVDELTPLLGAPVSRFAVDGFFFLSGMLVYSSLLRRGSAVDFGIARLARLWPGLFVSVVATVIVGAFATEARGIAYLHGPTARFLLGNLSLTAPGYDLTGIRCSADPCTINGSLWTITWEVRCYIALIALLLTGLASPGAMKRIVLPASLVFAVAMHLPFVTAAIQRHGGHGLIWHLTLWDRLWSMFTLGIAAHLWRERILLSWRICAALLAATILSAQFLPIPHLRGVFTGYAVLCGGFLSARRGVISGDWPDYSYGMYIYAFPVMMAVAALIPVTHHAPLAAMTFLATLPLAALSWHWVEKPALDLVRRRRRPAQRLMSRNSERSTAR
jgi:peptidoglycan/LPS O-acetylase OafA/YrhL